MMNDIKEIVFLAVKETSGVKYLPKSLCAGAIDYVCYQKDIVLNEEEKAAAEKLMVETLEKLWTEDIEDIEGDK